MPGTETGAGGGVGNVTGAGVGSGIGEYVGTSTVVELGPVGVGPAVGV